MNLTLLKTFWKYKKYIGYATAVIGLVVAIWQFSGMLYDQIYERGRYDMRQEMLQSFNDQMLEMRKKYEEETQKALNTMKADYDAELKRVRDEKEIEVKTEKVIEYVYKEIEVPAACNQLASDVIWVLQEGVNTIRATRNE